MASDEVSEKTHLLSQENITERGSRTDSNITESWKGILSTLSEPNRQRIRFDSLESVDSQGASPASISSFEEGKEMLLSFEAYLKNLDYYCDNQASRYYEYPVHLLMCSCVVMFIGIVWSTYGSISNIWLTGFLYTSSVLLGVTSIYYFAKGYYLNNNIPNLKDVLHKTTDESRIGETQPLTPEQQ